MGRRWDPYAGVLAGPVDGPARVAAVFPSVPADPGLAVVHRASGFTGTLVRLARDGQVEVRGRTGLVKAFPARPGSFAVDGRPVTLVPPARRAGPSERPVARTASGSLALAGHRARVARAARILVEGVHDAELVERVWGDDLRIEGVVVERLDGADHLADVVHGFGPGPGRRLGVLLDHLLPGTKEARIAETVRHPDVLVTGTPFVDVWQAVRPGLVGLRAWPEIPRGTDWKEGVCRHLGGIAPGELWRRILKGVRSYADLDPHLVGAMERLIDFVTADA